MTEELRNILPEILLTRREPVECDCLTQWLPIWRAIADCYRRHGPYTVAIAAASEADRLAWAFFSGYQGALGAAFPELNATAKPRIASLGANESGRKLTEINTALGAGDDGLRLTGQKSWVLSGIDELDLYVLARAVDAPTKGPGSLIVVRLPSTAKGVLVGTPRAQAVVPELPHSAVSFSDVPIDHQQIIPGDGYSDHAKPFRLREDVFVTGSTLAFLLAQGNANAWSTRWRQRCMAVIVTLGECAARSPNDTATELLTAGALSLAGEVIEQAEGFMAKDAPSLFDRWCRDKPLLALGKDARRQRAQSAWTKMGSAE